EPAGLLPSSFTSRVLEVSPGRRCRRTRGVLPMQSAMVGYCTVMAMFANPDTERGAYDSGKPAATILRNASALEPMAIRPARLPGEQSVAPDRAGGSPRLWERPWPRTSDVSRLRGSGQELAAKAAPTGCFHDPEALSPAWGG